MATRLDYRADIDGLRGIAVLAVMAYHYRLPLPGGFAGVDVFFVISGYLITAIIRAELLDGRFSLAGFFERRVRRIVPALAAMLMITLVLGYVLLWPKAYQDAGNAALAAMFGLSNFYFAEAAGYFDLTAELHPFLHTWSLGVEEQFYLVWPLLLLGLWRWRQRLVAWLVAGIALSFALSLWAESAQPQWSFYLLPFRAWELALGGLVAFLPPLRHAVAARLAGLGLVAVGLVIDHNALRGWGSLLLPCLGAALIARPAVAPSWADRPLTPLAAIGRMSYSLYLWHWPLLVLYRQYRWGAFPAPLEIAAIAGVALIAAYLSWRFVEQPFRRLAQPRRAVFRRGAAIAGAVALLAGCVIVTSGAVARFDPGAQNLLDGDAMWAWACPDMQRPAADWYCSFGADWTMASQRVVLFGDSHAEHLVPLLHDLYRDTDMAFMAAGTCAPMVGGLATFLLHNDKTYPAYCRASWSKVIALLASNDDIGMVVMSALWARRFAVLYADPPADYPSQMALVHAALRQVLEAVSNDLGRRIVIVSDTPTLTRPHECQVAARSWVVLRMPCAAGETISREAFTAAHAESQAALEQAAAAFPSALLINPGDGLCAAGDCLSEFDGVNIYRDQDHFRRDLPPALNRRLGALLGLDGLDALYPAR